MSLLLPSSPSIHRFTGTLIGPDDDGYDDARRVHNAMIDRRPALIARCESVSDVAAALAYAREHELEVAVRAGGHSAPGFATTDGGLMIDLGPLKAIDVEPARPAGFPNFIAEGGDAAVAVAYGAERHARLVEVKDRWDPANVFGVNHNIRPSA